MTMAHSLEARQPLLDHKCEFAATIRRAFANAPTSTFKQAMPVCCRSISTQKHGFAVPIARWFPRARRIRGDVLRGHLRQSGFRRAFR